MPAGDLEMTIYRPVQWWDNNKTEEEHNLNSTLKLN